MANGDEEEQARKKAKGEETAGSTVRKDIAGKMLFLNGG